MDFVLPRWLFFEFGMKRLLTEIWRLVTYELPSFDHWRSRPYSEARSRLVSSKHHKG